MNGWCAWSETVDDVVVFGEVELGVFVRGVVEDGFWTRDTVQRPF